MIKNNNNEYIINNYVYTEVSNNDIVLQNKDGIVRIHNEQMKDLIREWDTKTGQVISEDYLKYCFKDKYERAKEFLLSYKIIKIKTPLNYNIKTLNFVTNHKEVSCFAEMLFMHDYANQIEVKISDVDNFHISSNDLVVVFLNPYSKSEAKNILNAVKTQRESVMLMSYIYNNNYYIDSFYSMSWRNPCHFCHISHIESQLRISLTGNITYQHLIDALYHEKNTFKVETKLSYYDVFSIVTTLTKQIEKFIIRDSLIMRSEESLEEINNCLMMDLKTKNVVIDTGIYWELCDCYE